MQNSPPDHWLMLPAPSNWFRIYYPPQWDTEEREGTIALRPPDTDALLAINTVWVSEEEPTVLPDVQEIVSHFPERRNVTEGDGESVAATRCLHGDAILTGQRSWWEKLLKSSDWRSWTIWEFRRPKLLIVMTLLHAGDRDPELETIVRMILSTLEICEEPADPPEVFSQRAVELARSKFPLLDSKLVGEFQLQIETSRLNLANFYRAYVRDPDQFEKILLPAFSTAVQVQGWGERETTPPLDIVRERIMPMLYPEHLWREKFPDIVGEQWIAGLVILYVVDESNAYWYVRHDLVEKWELTREELHDLAIENLNTYFENEPMEMAVAATEEGGATLMMPGKLDSYNSVRLLSHSFLDKMREVTGGDLAVGVPGRDFFIAVAVNSEEIVGQVRRQVKTDFEKTDHPLTDRMLLVTADGVSELLDDIE